MNKVMGKLRQLAAMMGLISLATAADEKAEIPADVPGKVRRVLWAERQGRGKSKGHFNRRLKLKLGEALALKERRRRDRKIARSLALWGKRQAAGLDPAPTVRRSGAPQSVARMCEGERRLNVARRFWRGTPHWKLGEYAGRLRAIRQERLGEKI